MGRADAGRADGVARHQPPPARTAAAGLGAGCGGALPGPCDDGSCGSQVSAKVSFQFSWNRPVDLLLVIDDTSAIAPYTGGLATGLAAMAQHFTSDGTGPEISLHAG